MAADITGEFAAKTAAAGVSSVLAWAFHLTPELFGAGLVGSMTGMLFIKTELGPLRAAALFVCYALGAAIVARWAVTGDEARMVLTWVLAVTGHWLIRILIGRASKHGGEWIDRILGAKKP